MELGCRAQDGRQEAEFPPSDSHLYKKQQISAAFHMFRAKIDAWMVLILVLGPDPVCFLLISIVFFNSPPFLWDLPVVVI